MSLINQALKRAELDSRSRGDGQARPAAAAFPSPVPAVQPAGRARLSGRKGYRTVAILAVLAAAAIGMVLYVSLPPGRQRQSSQSPPPAPAIAARIDEARSNGLKIPPGMEVIQAPTDNPDAPSLDQFTLSAPSNPPVPHPAEVQAAAADRQPAAKPARPAPPLDSGTFKLGGILKSGSDAHALINNQMLTVGDQVEGATVIAIEKYHVVIEKDGRQLILRI